MNPIPRRPFLRAYRAAALISACALAPIFASAAEPDVLPEITVSAERPASKIVGRTSSGIPIRQYQLSYSISYGDLDLSTSAGASELKNRVKDAAKWACKDLDTLYPEIDPDRSCVRKASEKSMAQVDRAITLAQTKARAAVH